MSEDGDFWTRLAQSIRKTSAFEFGVILCLVTALRLLAELLRYVDAR